MEKQIEIWNLSIFLFEMDVGGAYGGGKAGGAFNPITFIQRPQVLLRAICWVSR